MVYLLATFANDADLMPSLLHSVRHGAPEKSEEKGETWGVGYYADNRALIIQRPAEILSERSFFELASDVQSRVVLACVHPPSANDAPPPYRFRQWLFGYGGDLNPMEGLRQKVVEKLPGFLKTEVGEGTGGKLALAMFMAELHRSGILDDTLAPPRAISDGLSKTAEMIHSLSKEEGSEVKAAYFASNGRYVIACPSGVPLYQKEQIGLEAKPDGPPDPAMTDFYRAAEALKRFRAIVISGGVSPDGEWTTIPDGICALVDRDLKTYPSLE